MLMSALKQTMEKKMKLIELLVQETLNGNFKWPEGIKYLEQYTDGSLFSGNSYESYYRYDRVDDFGKDEVTREQYEAALAASKPEWDGEGPPPVGCECEWQDKNTKLWIPVVIAYSSEWVTVVRELKPLKVGDAVECCINNFGEEERLHFRPIRSEAYKKRDEAIEEINTLVGDIEKYPTWRDAIAAIYDAGYRKVGE